MSKEQVKVMIAALAAAHDEVMSRIATLGEEDLSAMIAMGSVAREVRWLLLQVGNHDRDHTIQVHKNLQWLGRQFSEAQMAVAKAHQARGELLGLLAAVSDDDLDRTPKEGDWTIRQTLQHLVDFSKRHCSMIDKALYGR